MIAQCLKAANLRFTFARVVDMSARMTRVLALILSLVSLGWSLPAAAAVTMTFQSFNGSVFFGRYPHTFVVLRGTLNSTGAEINENFGFTAKTVSTKILSGPVEHEIVVEPQKYVTSTNRHFSVKLTDAQYGQVVAEMKAWRDAPGKFYSLDDRNCIHFVGKLAQIAGLKVDYPEKMLRKPKKWLNYITGLNPQLGANPIK
jgi:hypothetical protein